MDRCYYVNDPVAGRVLIPGCWGSVVGHCTCGPKKSRKNLEREVEELKARVAALEASPGYILPKPKRV